jgi:ABC-type Fe3+ transport system permease subunit
MIIPLAIVQPVVGWGLLLAALWAETALQAPVAGSMPLTMAAATVTLAPLLFGLFLALSLARRPVRSACWLEALLALCFLAVPYAESVGLFSISGWWGSVCADSTARGLVVVWFALAFVQGLRPTIAARPSPAQGQQPAQEAPQKSGAA